MVLPIGPDTLTIHGITVKKCNSSLPCKVEHQGEVIDVNGLRYGDTLLILSPDAFENLRASMKGEDWDANFEYMIMRIPEHREPLSLPNSVSNKYLAFDTEIRVPLYLNKNNTLNNIV